MGMSFFAHADEPSRETTHRPKYPIDRFEAHWSAGALIPRGGGTGVELSLGPRYCEYRYGAHECGLPYFSIEMSESHRLVSTGLGYFGQAHGIPGGIFYDGGFVFQGDRRVGQHRTLTVSVPPVFVPLFFRWTDGSDSAPRYTIGVTLKYVNMLGLFNNPNDVSR
jgi:hypothetical protein